jgi:hypothetical protein
MWKKGKKEKVCLLHKKVCRGMIFCSFLTIQTLLKNTKPFESAYSISSPKTSQLRSNLKIMGKLIDMKTG